MVIILTILALVTSVISGMIGMGGGILLLAAMTFFLPLQIIIPIHGIVQLISNSSRGFYLRKNILWSWVYPFLIGTPFGLYVSYKILKNFSHGHFYYLIMAFFITYIVFKPKKFAPLNLNKYGLFALGILAGIQGPLLGAIGPLIAPFFIREDIKKEEIVATKASFQIIGHLFKIPLFLSLDFNYFHHVKLFCLMSVAAIIGSYIGVNLLKKLNDQSFRFLFKIVLLIAAVRLYLKFLSSL